jgi:hypothetical protein
LPRSGREGLGKRTHEGTVPDSAAVLIVLAPNASAGLLRFLYLADAPVASPTFMEGVEDLPVQEREP